MKFEKINKNNIIKATKAQLEIFGEKECAFLHYKNSFITQKDYYLVYDNDKVVGITGLYIDEFTQEPGVIWLGWFGVLDSERHKGYGQQILKKTIALAKMRGFKTFRLYTTSTNLPACHLYDKIMDFREDYCQEEDVKNCVIYSKSLNGRKAPKLGERYLGITWHDKEQEEGLKMFLRESK